MIMKYAPNFTQFAIASFYRNTHTHQPEKIDIHMKTNRRGKKNSPVNLCQFQKKNFIDDDIEENRHIVVIFF